jgi:hypothetical protein
LKHVPTAPSEDTSVAADAGAIVGGVDGGVGPSTLFQKIFFLNFLQITYLYKNADFSTKVAEIALARLIRSQSYNC